MVDASRESLEDTEEGSIVQKLKKVNESQSRKCFQAIKKIFKAEN